MEYDLEIDSDLGPLKDGQSDGNGQPNFATGTPVEIGVTQRVFGD